MFCEGPNQIIFGLIRTKCHHLMWIYIISRSFPCKHFSPILILPSNVLPKSLSFVAHRKSHFTINSLDIWMNAYGVVKEVSKILLHFGYNRIKCKVEKYIKLEHLKLMEKFSPEYWIIFSTVLYQDMQQNIAAGGETYFTLKNASADNVFS